MKEQSRHEAVPPRTYPQEATGVCDERDPSAGNSQQFSAPDEPTEQSRIDELRAEIEMTRGALKSLVKFREMFIPDDEDVQPAKFHEEWSDILLNGTGHFAIEAFRESAKTQIVIRANLLHALTFPQENRSYLVVICATQTTASKKLQEVSREFKQNPDMFSLVSNVVEDNGGAFEAVYKGGQKVRIEAYGKGAAVRGLSWGGMEPLH